MRGIRFLPDGYMGKLGITPAHAGNTLANALPSICNRDHPRACGEYVPSGPSTITGSGSPPRMRGIRLDHKDLGLQTGITPAHAGNTAYSADLFLMLEDHPRACGEYCTSPAPAASVRGSPPRMRGIPEVFKPCGCQTGITPAHAGNTGHSLTVSAVFRDHPRACGEYNGLVFPTDSCQGSPPRMRGIPSFRFVTMRPPRITPAHAGNT